MKKTPAIPSVGGVPQQAANVLLPLKQNVEFLTGVSAAKIAKLGLTATVSDVINKVNDMIDRLQGEK